MQSSHRVLISIKTFSHKGELLIREAIQKLQGQLSLSAISSVYLVDRPAESWAGLRDIQKEEHLEGLALVVKATTVLSAREVLRILEGIEMELQREVLRRSLSMNLLVYNNEIVTLPGLAIPHPEMHNRPEDIVPAVEVWPDYVHPVLKKTILELSEPFKSKKWGEFYTQGAPLLDKQLTTN